MSINALRDAFGWFLNLFSCLPFAFKDFAIFCLFAYGFIWLTSLWRDA